MKTKSLLLNAAIIAVLAFQIQTAFAVTPFPSAATDLPPGAMSYGNVDKGTLPADPNIVAAIIGVVGLLIGSAITIFATLFVRHMDIRRDDKREQMMVSQNRKEKEYQIKQEIYKNFLHELSHLETFSFKDLDNFKKEWTKTEVKVDLVASAKVRHAKESVQNELLNIAEKNIKANTAQLSQNYLKLRDDLLEAIREDIDIFQQ